jgi:micrococcal nuclease
MTIIGTLTTGTAAVALAAGLTACTGTSIEDASHPPAPTAVAPAGRAAPESLCDLGSCETATVERPIDGDTIDVTTTAGKVERVRILGVDTPETKKPNTPVQCFGPEASQATAEMAPTGTTVTLVTDDQADSVDKYHRLLRHVVLGADGQGANLGHELLAQGCAHTTTFPHALADDYAATQDAARSAGTGLWGQC